MSRGPVAGRKGIDVAAPLGALGEEQVLEAFRHCQEPNWQQASRLLPDVVAAAESISETLGVTPLWALLGLLGAVGLAHPRCRLELAPSIEVPPSLWICLCQPGATNSSGVIKVFSTAIQQLFARRFQDERRQHEGGADGEPDGAGAARPRMRKGLAGGGSLAAVGLQLSQKQNRDAALAVVPENVSILSWFSEETVVDKSAPGKL